MKTCMGCLHYKKTMIRGQYFNICQKNMVTAPFRACQKHEPRHGEVVQVKQRQAVPVEIL